MSRRSEGTHPGRERLEAVRTRHRGQALARGINPRDVDLLLSDLLGKPVTYLLAHGDIELEDEPLAHLLERRYAGEPLQYIRRRSEFYSREFYVDDRVLIPRPETEILVESALDLAPRGARAIDIGTGSGCIGITLERERPDLVVTAIDLSLAALAVAQHNRDRLGSRVRLVASDLLDAVTGEFDLIVSNPPYIAAAEVEHLAPEVKSHEPRLALTPGPEGTEAIARLLDQAHERLAAGGRMLLEIGFGQESRLHALAVEKGFEVERIVPDLAAIPRVVILSAA